MGAADENEDVNEERIPALLKDDGEKEVWLKEKEVLLKPNDVAPNKNDVLKRVWEPAAAENEFRSKTKEPFSYSLSYSYENEPTPYPNEPVLYSNEPGLNSKEPLRL